MATTYTATITVNFVVAENQPDGLIAAAGLNINEGPSIGFANGNGAGLVSQAFGAIRTFSGTSDSVNVGTGGGLVDVYGNAIAMARVKGLYLNNTGVDPLTLGAGTDPITTLLNSTGTLTLPAGAIMAIATPDATGWAVTASTACSFNFTGTNGQTYRIGVLGNAS